jgi:predicted nicotinamide N-methyase
LWASGEALARAVAERDVEGLRVVELGCGLALPSLAAALGGARVLATDWSPDAIALARENALRNELELELETAVVRWSEPDPLVERAPWDLVLAADVLYEMRNVDELLALLPKLGNEVLIADPGRPHAKTFFERAREAWTVQLRGQVFHVSRKTDRPSRSVSRETWKT